MSLDRVFTVKSPLVRSKSPKSQSKVKSPKSGLWDLIWSKSPGTQRELTSRWANGSVVVVVIVVPLRRRSGWCGWAGRMLTRPGHQGSRRPSHSTQIVFLTFFLSFHRKFKESLLISYFDQKPVYLFFYVGFYSIIPLSLLGVSDRNLVWMLPKPLQEYFGITCTVTTKEPPDRHTPYPDSGLGTLGPNVLPASTKSVVGLDVNQEAPL